MANLEYSPIISHFWHKITQDLFITLNVHKAELPVILKSTFNTNLTICWSSSTTPSLESLPCIEGVACLGKAVTILCGAEKHDTQHNNLNVQ